MLGYKVADYVETCEADFQKRDSDSLTCISFGLAHILKIVKLMSETWLQFFEGKIDAKTVLEKYKEWGNNQDLQIRAPQDVDVPAVFESLVPVLIDYKL